MGNLKEKKGISLIVLVITIIVMIILAAAIILSISNSGIMDKANKAKTDSDAANLKEYVNVLEAEWELQAEGTESYSSKEAYVNGKLADKYPNAALGADGEVYTGLNEAARKAIAGGIKIGDVVTGYTLDSSDSKKSYTTSGNENTAPSSTETDPTSQTVTRIEYTTWKYIGIGENGEVLIAPDMVSSVTTAQKIKLSGKGGYLNGPKELNDMCAAMYSTTKGIARSMNRDDITRILDYTGHKGEYVVVSADGNNLDSVETLVPKKISEVNPSFSGFSPDERDIGEYYLNFYSISPASKNILKLASDDLKTILKSFVFINDESTYFLASTSNYAHFEMNFVEFGVDCVSYIGSVHVKLYDSKGSSSSADYGFARPVVQLNSDVSVSYSNGTLTLN